jgi:hypothetical protein
MHDQHKVEMIILARQRAHRDALKAAAGGRQLTRLELKEGIVQGGVIRSKTMMLQSFQIYHSAVLTLLVLKVEYYIYIKTWSSLTSFVTPFSQAWRPTLDRCLWCWRRLLCRITASNPLTNASRNCFLALCRFEDTEIRQLHS